MLLPLPHPQHAWPCILVLSALPSCWLAVAFRELLRASQVVGSGRKDRAECACLMGMLVAQFLAGHAISPSDRLRRPLQDS
jgi:hypothetical protein